MWVQEYSVLLKQWRHLIDNSVIASAFCVNGTREAGVESAVQGRAALMEWISSHLESGRSRARKREREQNQWKSMLTPIRYS